MPKAKVKKIEIEDTVSEIHNKDKDLVDFIIKEIPNCFDSFPKGSVSRTAVEHFVKKLKEKI